MKFKIAWVAAWLISAGLFFSGCSGNNPSDIAGIHTNYVAFRAALIADDIDKAKLFMTADIQDLPRHRIIPTYSDFMQPQFALTPKAHITFDKSRTGWAWLWPNSPASVGTCGIGFTKETNGWKINGELMVVSH